MTTDPIPYLSSSSLSSSITISTGRRPILGIYELSLQKAHCHGHTRLVIIVATGGGLFHPHSGSKGHLNFLPMSQCGLGHRVRSIIGHSARDLAPIPFITPAKVLGFFTKSTIMPSPGP